jgi:hypothetical protein
MQYHLIEKKSPKTGYFERVVFSGSLRGKPKGWRVVREIL